MSYCGACGASISPSAGFCGACGKPSAGGKSPEIDLGFVCPECHQFNDAGAKVCRSCNSSLIPAGFTGFLRAADIPGVGGPPKEDSAPSPAESAGASSQPFVPQPTPTAEAQSAAPAEEAAADPSATTDPALQSQQARTPAPPLGEPVPGPETTPSPTAQAGSSPALAPRPAPGPAPGPGTLAFGPLQPGRAKLVLVRGRGFKGAEFRLNSPEVVVGRSQGFVLFPDDPHLADRHATLLYLEGHLCLRDDGGPGGTWLRIREPVALRANAELAVGDTRLAIQELPAEPERGRHRAFGAPRGDEAFRVEERLAADRAGRAWVCRGDLVTIGSDGASVCLHGDPLVSRRHAEIRRMGPRWVIADSGGPDGTFVRVAPGINVPLRHSDRFRVGSEVFEIQVAA